VSRAEESARAALGPAKFEADFNAGQRSRTPEDHQSGALGKREAEVARLIADGLTNKQIGSRLFISEHTVDSHVRSIMGGRLTRPDRRPGRQPMTFLERLCACVRKSPPAADPQFGVHVCEVSLDRALANVETGRDLAVGQAGGCEPGHHPLPLAERACAACCTTSRRPL
jgi:hypothetical protein